MYTVIALSAGATIGAIARWQLGLWLNVAHTNSIGWGTLAANSLGAYLVGLGFVWLQTQPAIDPVWRLFIITGCLGALTTFSTFSLETVQLLQNGHIGTAVSNVVLNVVASLTLTYAGLLTGRWIH